MKKFRSLLLVVDASVAGSAGETEHPVSKACRDALTEICEICHKIVITQLISEEWKKHARFFALKWFNSMIARKKFKYFKEEYPVPLSTDRVNLNPHDKKALQKDLHLISAACAGDGFIISRDEEIKNIWSSCRRQIKTPKPIRWINPVSDGTDCLHHLDLKAKEFEREAE
jgi:hypothetical protein